MSVPPEVPLREFPYNAVVELVNPVADTVSRKTYTGADVDWYVKAEDIVLKNKGNQNAGNQQNHAPQGQQKKYPQMILHDEDCIDLGNRKLVVIHTPGHSPGHCCFYEADRKYLYSGDLIYSGCLDAFYPSTNPQEFWKSVRKIQSLKISRILPGHHHLSIPVTIIDKIETAFHNLSNEGKLKQGNGIFSYEGFQIHI